MAQEVAGLLGVVAVHRGAVPQTVEVRKRRQIPALDPAPPGSLQVLQALAIGTVPAAVPGPLRIG